MGTFKEEHYYMFILDNLVLCFSCINIQRLLNVKLGINAEENSL